MRTRLPVLLTAAAALAALLASPHAAADLVGYWDFNEGAGTAAADSSGQGNDGTLAGAPRTPTWVAGHTGAPGDSALHFDGTDDNVAVPDSRTLSVRHNLTASAWVNLDAHTAPHKNILAKDGNNAYRYRLHGSTPNNTQWVLVNDGAGLQTHFSTTTVTAGTWEHAAVTVDFDEQMVRFYRNGTLADVMPTSKVGIADTGGGLILGAYQASGSEAFDGALDDIAVWSRRLPASQINALATGTAPTSLPAAMPGALDYIRITGDGDCQIGTDKTYTHALDCGTAALATVNEVPFTRITRNTASYPANFHYQPSEPNRDDHAGNANTGVPAGSDMYDLLEDMIYDGGCPAGGVATVTLSGLIPGVRYDTRIYTRRWAGSDRQVTVGFSTDGGRVAENSVYIYEDDATQNPPGFVSPDQAYALSCQYLAQGSRAEVTFEQHNANASWHLYGLTNEFVPATTRLSARITGDDSYRLLLSGDPDHSGLVIGSAGGWETPEDYVLDVPVGQRLALNIVGHNGFSGGGDWAGVIAQFTLPQGYFFATPDGLTPFLATSTDWSGNALGFDELMGAVTDIGAYGCSPWGTTPGAGAFDPSAHWIWYGAPLIGQGTTYGDVFLRYEFTIVTPEPTTLSLLGLGGLGLLARRRRRRQR